MENRIFCDLCQSPNESWKKMFLKNNFTIVRCKKCGFVFTQEVPNNEELSLAYSKNYYNGDIYKNYLENAMHRRISYFFSLNQFRNSTGILSGKILEIGCATGDFLDVAKFLGYDTSGIEISEWAASISKGKGHNIINADVTQFFNNETLYPMFDAIFLWDVFEHLAYPNIVLANISKTLNAGGAVVINTLNIDSPTVKYLNDKWSNYIPPYHLSFFNTRTLKRALAQQGIRVLKSKTTGPLFYDGDFNKSSIFNHIFNNRIASAITSRLKLGYLQTIIGIKL